LCRWEPWHCRLHLHHQWIAGGYVLTLAHSDSGARPSTDPDAEPNANSRSATKPDAYPDAGAVSYADAAPWTYAHAHSHSYSYSYSYSGRVARPRGLGGGRKPRI
jgi:hypothetical protein